MKSCFVAVVYWLFSFRRLFGIKFFIFGLLKCNRFYCVLSNVRWIQLKMFLITKELCGWLCWNGEPINVRHVFMLRITSQNGAFFTNNLHWNMFLFPNIFTSSESPFIRKCSCQILGIVEFSYQRYWTIRFVPCMDCATGNRSYLLCFVDLPVKVRHTFQFILIWFHRLKLQTVYAPTTAWRVAG